MKRHYITAISTAVFLCFWPIFAQNLIPPDREGLLKGDGMGMAAPAEMKGFPGPKHVLESKDQLGLTPDQTMKTKALFESVKSSAVAKGEDIIRAEGELAALFAAGSISEKHLEQKVLEVAKLRGDLRFVHLQAHLRMTRILTADQIERYKELREHALKH